MKTIRLKFHFVVLLLLLSGACNLPGTPTAIATEPPPSPALVSIDLAGPEMSVGSTFLYADGTTLVAVPGGIFTMGGDGPDNSVHQVNLSDFWIYSTKVTNRQYAYCVASGLCAPPQLRSDNPAFDDPLRANDPMVGVDFDQAAAYCNFVHGRLPTEAEWEKAARGPNGNIYPWGDGAPSCDLLNFGICVGSTTSVTTYPAGRSFYDAFDMAGNALEWVADWYQADYYLNAPADNPKGPEEGRERSVRSSAFNSGSDQIFTFTRSHSSPDTQRDNLGFRCVVDDPTYFAPFCEYPATYGTDGIGGPTAGAQSVVTCPAFGITQDPQCVAGSPITYVTSNGPPGTQMQVIGGACQLVTSSPPKYGCTQNGTLEVCARCTVELRTAPICPDGYDFNGTTKKCDPHPKTSPAGSANCLPGYVPQQGSSAESSGSANQCCGPAPIVAGTANPVAPTCVLNPNVSPYLFCHCPAGLVMRNDVCEPPAPPTQPAPTPLPSIGGWQCELWFTQYNDELVPSLVCQHWHFQQCPAGTNFDGQECISTTYQDTCKSEGISLSSCSSGGGGGPSCPPPAGGCPNSGEEWNSATCSCYCPGGPGFCG